MNKTYGRKIIKSKDIYARRLLILIIICALVGFLLGMLAGTIMHQREKKVQARSFNDKVYISEILKKGVLHEN